MQHWLMHIFIHNSISDFMFHWPLPEWVEENLEIFQKLLNIFAAIVMDCTLHILAWLELILVSEIRKII